MTGKLAAGVAHSIRNPLTSVKIRLFSMGRTAHLSPALQEDLEVISEEIGHIESIVRSFLAFSRPPKLTMQKISPSEVVDTALRLLKHRLESYGVEVELIREESLAEIWADPDQLKEVLVNLLVNACEVMINGGVIRISEKEEESGDSWETFGIHIRQRQRSGHTGVDSGKYFSTLFQHQRRGHRSGIKYRLADRRKTWRKPNTSVCRGGRERPL